MPKSVKDAKKPASKSKASPPEAEAPLSERKQREIHDLNVKAREFKAYFHTLGGTDRNAEEETFRNDHLTKAASLVDEAVEAAKKSILG